MFFAAADELDRHSGARRSVEAPAAGAPANPEAGRLPDTLLQAQNAHLLVALDNMRQGLTMFDAAERLIFCNKRYLRMHGLSPDLLRPGCSLRELLELRVRTATLFGDVDHIIERTRQRIASGKTTRSFDEWVDGRVVAIEITPTGGGGWVTSHDDVTEHVRTVDQLRRTKNFLDTIIDHVPATIIVKDAANFRYILVNKNGEEYLGHSKDELIGRSADELFPPETVAAIVEQDKKALTCPQQQVYQSAPLHDPERPVLIQGKKVVVRSPSGKPEYLMSIIEDVTERVQAAERLSFQARHDALTGLPNRVQLMERIDDALSRLKRRGERFTVMLLDLDRFKSVNDSLGHPIGDGLLKAVAQRLKASLRDTDFVARLGGDEFAILQTFEGDQREAAVALSNRILDVFTATFDIDGNQVVTGTSIGIAFAPEHGTDVDQLMKGADLALYRAKSRGRNQYCIFEPGMETEAHSRHSLEIDLRNALKQAEFELHFQPVFDAVTETPCGAEALVRWRRPQKDLVSPAEFIPLAEETGLIVPLGEWVLRTACIEATSWPSRMKVAVNVSPVQFRKGDLVDTVARALIDSNLAPERLELEITESVLLHNNEENLAILSALKSLGVSIVLDDFGTGYSSLSYLKMFPFDKIKIDRSFVTELSNRPDCAAIVCAIVNLARILNMVTTAEGIETREQLLLLRAAGCSFAQGYLLGRPVRGCELGFDIASGNARGHAAA
ncbi:MAG TPA: EAL domain-containing protein [Pseudolabrys sp.]|nr:EAL domain-containing protein [Pseudolabrys sp.]